jgi:8-oxo-dGTP pyrophosphatase MutT (NUDIX family)
MPSEPESVPLFARADGTELRRHPHGSGDRWVEGPDGRKFWGAYGAAGLLVHHPDVGILLQHRVEWSHFGGTWGLPGGARQEGESAAEGAVREATEEAGVPGAGIALRFSSVLDLGWWSYTTVVADARTRFAPTIGDAESLEVRWVPVEDVASLPLHPGFASSWPSLRDDLTTRVVLIVDSANVVGSRPDGWWKDRPGATARLAAELGGRARSGFASAALGLPQHTWWPEVRLVTEGQARSAQWDDDAVGRVVAEADGDSRILAEAQQARSEGARTLVVTADRELADRVRAAGAELVSPGALLAQLRP